MKKQKKVAARECFDVKVLNCREDLRCSGGVGGVAPCLLLPRTYSPTEPGCTLMNVDSDDFWQGREAARQAEDPGRVAGIS